MSSIAVATIVGRLGRDPETKSTPGGKTVTSFSVAVDSGYGDNKKTSWFNVQTWDALAERVPKFAKKGALVAVTGRLVVEEWAKNGEKQSRTVVVANDVQRLDTREAEGGGASSPRASAAPDARKTEAPPARQTAAVSQKSRDDDYNDAAFLQDDEIPF